jgi:hypothetical protein
MLKRNPQREALLLAKWREGKTVREAARETGIPEGTTSYYWKKFNKHPETANRLAQNLKPREKLQVQDYVIQMFFAVQAREAKDLYDSLVSQGKYAEAKSSIEARAELERYIASKMSTTTSVVPVYLADPKLYEPFIGRALGEMLQNKEAAGAGKIEAIDQVEKDLAALSPSIPPEHMQVMTIVLRMYRNQLPQKKNSR